MPEPKRAYGGKRIAVGLMIFLFVLAMPELSREQQSSDTVSDQLQSMTNQELQNEKLRSEIRKLQLENRKLENPWGQLPFYTALVTALVAIAGVFITVWRLNNERKADREQREEDSRRRQEEKFRSIVANLGVDSPALQASAAVSIITFLKPKYREFHNQVFMIVYAHLKIQHDEAINKLLIGGFEQAIRIQLESIRERDKQFILDLSRTNLNRIDLSDVDLRYADLGFAQLEGADLTHTELYRVQGFGANLNKARLSGANLEEARFREAHFWMAQFHKANLVSARLEETDLRGAQFQQARLQSAHLDGADLRGARFEQANINDAFFRRAKFDEKALKSIVKAYNWQNATFDDEIKRKLEKLA